VNAFWLSLAVTFWAEMGDKTQLLALAYAARYRLRDVLVGVAVATALVHLVSVALGRLIAHSLPLTVIHALAAASFAAFAIWTLREGEGSGGPAETRHHPILFIGTTFFLGELGDKTMLAAVTLATQWPWVGVWLGTTVGMVLSDGIAIAIGRSLGRRLPAKLVKGVAAGLFIVFAAWNAWQAF
jgi:putative Ca2+/H+ antiporter (TMEM165/GDT1 family)